MNFGLPSHKSQLYDCLQTGNCLVARLQTEPERSLDMRPSLFVGDFSLAYISKKLCGDNIVCVETAEHLKKGTTALSQGVQSLDMSSEHLWDVDNGIGYQALVFRSLQNSAECYQLSLQDKRNSFSLEPFFTLALSPIGPRDVHRRQNDRDGPNGLNPSSGPRMGFYPCQHGFRKLETVEHSLNLGHRCSFVEGVAA